MKPADSEKNNGKNFKHFHLSSLPFDANRQLYFNSLSNDDDNPSKVIIR